MAGQQFEYTFDDAGNRTSTRVGGDNFGGNLHRALYQANAKNQYDWREVPPYVSVLGTAHPEAKVTVDNGPAWRHGDYYCAEVELANGSGRASKEITVRGVRFDRSANQDVMTETTGKLSLPPAREAFVYDARGNLHSDGNWIYTWDAENRLILMERAGEQRIAFAYDFMGRRVRKVVTDLGTGVSTERRFLYDGWNLVAEFDGTRTLLRSYLWGLDLGGGIRTAGGVGGLLMVGNVEAPSGTYFAAADFRGNVVGLFAADGALQATYEYGPFGEVLRATGPMAKANPFRFSTKYQDEETDLLYYGYRYYSASTGRWISRDPWAELGGLNVYGFVLNSPANIADSDGRGYFWTNPSSQNGVPLQVSMTLFTDTTTGDSSSAYQLGWSWLTGSSDSSRHFSGHDQMAEQMRNSPEAAEARKRLKSELKGGCHVGLSEPFSRGLGGESRVSYVVGFASDMVNNPARAFLGSFSGRATVEKCFACCAVVKFELRDGQKGWESATHLPPPYGYPPPGQPENPALFETWYAPLGWGITWGLQMHNGRSPTLPSSILPNNALGKYGQNIDVTIDWEEILCP